MRLRAMGISTGGMTLLHMATKYPDRLVPRGGHVPILGRRAAQFLEVALEFLRGPAR